MIQSIPGKTNWNAIDPNLLVDKSGKPFLAFGSFWEGLKLAALNKDLFSIKGNIENLPTIASRL